MPRSREWFKKRVASRIDEVIPAGENVGGQTAIESPIETIEEELDFSVHYVLRTAKLQLLFPAVKSDKKHFHGTSVNDVDTRVIIDSNKKITIVCPEDFLRFVACKMASWKRELKAVIGQNDPKYRFQEGNKYTSGSIDKPEGAMVSFGEYISGELTKWTIDQTLSENESLAGLYNGVTPVSSGATVLSTGNILVLSDQEDEDENGTYIVNASPIAPTKLSDSITTVNSGTAIECFRAGSVNDTLEKFHYIPRLKVEEIPDDIIDPVIWHCAGRVLEFMGRMEESSAAMAKADALLGNLKMGLKGEM